MVIRQVTDFRKLVKIALKGGPGKGQVCVGMGMRAATFVVFVCGVFGYISVVVEGACVRD
jgi:hypothetical protein